MSPQAHACVDERHFGIVGPIFSIPSESSGSCFYLINRVHLISESKLNFFMYKRSLVITEAFFCDIFQSFCTGGRAKLARQAVCNRLYYACAPTDIVPLTFFFLFHSIFNTSRHKVSVVKESIGTKMRMRIATMLMPKQKKICSHSLHKNGS